MNTSDGQMASHHVVIASRNPVKINATLSGFRRSFPGQRFTAVGITCDSGVPDQPTSDEETRRGAAQRAAAARRQHPEADYWVGIEGGTETIAGQMMAFAWVLIHSARQTGQSRSGAFLLPPRVQALVREGQELGDANDAVFSQHNSKQQGGAIGLLTGDVIGREQLYEHAVILALVPFLSPDHFPSTVLPARDANHL